MSGVSLSVDQARKEFIKLIHSGDYSRSMYDKFSDMLELGYCAYAKLMAFSSERADALEERYMKVVDRYRKNERELEMIREVYPKLIGMTWNAVQEGGVDFLGAVSSELEILNSHIGQFFTPWSLTRMMAKMIIGSGEGIPEVIEGNGFITIGEPASGAGGMVLAAADEVQALGYDPGQHMLVHAVDASPMCFKMTYLQLSFRGVPALVVHGNSLSLEVNETAWTPATVGFFATHGRLFETHPFDDFVEAEIVEETFVRQAEAAIQQLRLF